MSKKLIAKCVLGVFLSVSVLNTPVLCASEEEEARVHRAIKGSLVVAAVATITFMAFAKDNLSQAQSLVPNMDKIQWNLSRYGSNSAVYQKALNDMQGETVVSNYKTLVRNSPLSSLSGAITQRWNAALAYQILAGIVGGGALLRLPFASVIDPLPFYIFTCAFTIIYGAALGADINQALSVPVQGLYDAFHGMVLSGDSHGTSRILLQQFQDYLRLTNQAAIWSYVTIPTPEAALLTIPLIAFSVWTGAYLVDRMGDAFDATVSCLQDCCRKNPTTAAERRKAYQQRPALSTRIGQHAANMGDNLNRLSTLALDLNNGFGQSVRRLVPLAQLVNVPKEERANVPQAAPVDDLEIGADAAQEAQDERDGNDKKPEELDLT